MQVEAFIDQYELLAALSSTTADELRQRDKGQAGPPQRWIATRDGRPAGAVSAFRRPDQRTFLRFACPDPAAYGPLTGAAGRALGRRLHTLVDAEDVDALDALTAIGFRTVVVYEQFRIRFDRALAMLERARVPPGFSIYSADEVDEGRLFTLDNTLRQDTPGTEGWRGNRKWFRDELAESPPFDPAAYLIAVDDSNGEYAGLVRIWQNPGGPRFGMVGVVRQYRSNTIIGPALLRQALTAASRWGEETFTAETSLDNNATYPHLKRLGAESLGQALQLVRH